MNNQKKNHYTLITGADAGIGKQIAFECAKRGYNLFLVSLPDTGLVKLSEEIRKDYKVDVKYFGMDLTKYEAPQKVFDYAQKNDIIVNILVNNAGLGFNGRFDNSTPKLIDDMILLNVRATTLLSYLFLPGMKKLEKAHILNISSFAALSPLPNKCIYAATKVYLQYFSQGLSYELKESGVTTTSIHPSGVSSERALENIKRSSLIARITTLTPSQVAKTAVEHMLKGTKFVIPGLPTKIYYYFGSILPHGIILRLVGLVFRKSA